MQQHNPCVTTLNLSKNMGLNILFVQVAPCDPGKQAVSEQNIKSCKFQLARNDSCQAVTDLFGWEHLLLLLRIPGMLGLNLSYKRLVDLCHNSGQTYQCKHGLFW